MHKKISILTIFIPIFFATWLHAGTLSISTPGVKPAITAPSGEVLISCIATHSDGVPAIERVAAVITGGGQNMSYPMLYDDGTNGDQVAEDGIYSLKITAPSAEGEAIIVFVAVDIDHNEMESAPIVLTVK